MQHLEMQKLLESKLQEMSELIGPRDCPHGRWVECEDDDCQFENTTARPSQMVQHFVVAVAWMDMLSEHGPAGSVALIAGPNQADYVTVGLLQSCLDLRRL